MNYFYRIPYYLPNLSELLSFYISQNVGLGLGTDKEENKNFFAF